MHLFCTSQHLEHLLLGLVRVLDDDAPDKVDGARRGRRAQRLAADVGHRLPLEIVSKRTEPIVTFVSFPRDRARLEDAERDVCARQLLMLQRHLNEREAISDGGLVALLRNAEARVDELTHQLTRSSGTTRLVL